MDNQSTPKLSIVNYIQIYRTKLAKLEGWYIWFFFWVTRKHTFKKIKKKEKIQISKFYFKNYQKFKKKIVLNFLLKIEKNQTKTTYFFINFLPNFLIFPLKNQKFWILNSLSQIFFVKKNQKLENKNSKFVLKMRTFFLFCFRKT